MRSKKGTVTATKMTGTVTVTVKRHAFHPIYRKRFRRSSSFLADCNGLDLYEGDVVTIEECRPLSKNKYFKVTEIIQAAPRVSDVKEESGVEEVIHREKIGADADAKAAKEKEKETVKKEKVERSEAQGDDAQDSNTDTDSADSNSNQ